MRLPKERGLYDNPDQVMTSLPPSFTSLSVISSSQPTETLRGHGLELITCADPMGCANNRTGKGCGRDQADLTAAGHGAGTNMRPSVGNDDAGQGHFVCDQKSGVCVASSVAVKTD